MDHKLIGSSCSRWLPVLLWAGVIFFFSTGKFSATNTSSVLEPLLNWLFPTISMKTIVAINFTIRKFGHWSEYFIFAVLLRHALRDEARKNSTVHQVIWTLAIVFLYAASDEFHQSFVPSRTASLDDVAIDFFGGACGSVWFFLRDKPRYQGP